MSKILKATMVAFAIATMFLLNACGTTDVVSNTIMESTFSTTTPTDSYNEKTIYVNQDMDKLELDAKLKVDSGNITIEVVNLSNDKVVWSEDYTEDSTFKIELTNLKAKSTYCLNIQAVQSKAVQLTITSNEKLIETLEKPAKEER